MPMDRIELFVATAITGFLVMMVAIVWMMFEQAAPSGAAQSGRGSA